MPQEAQEGKQHVDAGKLHECLFFFSLPLRCLDTQTQSMRLRLSLPFRPTPTLVAAVLQRKGETSGSLPDLDLRGLSRH